MKLLHEYIRSVLAVQPEGLYTVEQLLPATREGIQDRTSTMIAGLHGKWLFDDDHPDAQNPKTVRGFLSEFTYSASHALTSFRRNIQRFGPIGTPGYFITSIIKQICKDVLGAKGGMRSGYPDHYRKIREEMPIEAVLENVMSDFSEMLNILRRFVAQIDYSPKNLEMVKKYLRLIDNDWVHALEIMRMTAPPAGPPGKLISFIEHKSLKPARLTRRQLRRITRKQNEGAPVYNAAIKWAGQPIL